MFVCSEISCLLKVCRTQLQKISRLQGVLLNSDNHAQSLVTKVDTRNYFSPRMQKIFEAVKLFHCSRGCDRDQLQGKTVSML